MIGKCCFKDCSNSFQLYCRVCRSNNLFCIDHGLSHTSNHPKHEITDYFIEFNKSKSPYWEYQISLMIDNLQQAKASHLNSIKQNLLRIHEESQKTMKFIRNLEINLFSLLLKIHNLPSVIKASDFNILSSFSKVNLSAKEINLDFADFVAYSDQVQSAAVKFYEEIFRSEVLSEGLEIINDIKEEYKLERACEFDMLESEPEELVIFYPDGQNFKRLSLPDLDSNIIMFRDNMSVSSELGASATSYEGSVWYNTYQKDTYLIDLEQSTLKRLEKCATRNYYSRGIAYHKTNLYLFGGVGGKNGEVTVREAEVYTKSNWKPIALLPSVFKSTCASIVNDEIYLVGYSSNSLFTYNDYLNKYSVVADLADGPRCKVICGKYVLVNKSSFIYEIQGDSVRKVDVPNQVFCDTLAINCIFENSKFYYFLVWEGKLMRFSKETLKVEEICRNLVKE